jgi:hypothetical protein
MCGTFYDFKQILACHKMKKWTNESENLVICNEKKNYDFDFVYTNSAMIFNCMSHFFAMKDVFCGLYNFRFIISTLVCNKVI